MSSTRLARSVCNVRVLFGFGLAVLGFAGLAQAGPIGVVFIKNNHSSTVGIWINGYYQGYVPPNKTCYTVCEGFVTQDSGFNDKGELVIKESHAGWDNSGDQITLTAVGRGKDDKDKFYWQGTLSNSGGTSSGFLGTSEAYFWIGGDSEVSDLDKEGAHQIYKGGSGLNLKITRNLSPVADESEAKAGGYRSDNSTQELPAMQEGKGLPGTWRAVPDNGDPYFATFYPNGTSSSGINWTLSNNLYRENNGRSWRLRVITPDKFEFIPNRNEDRTVMYRVTPGGD